MVHELPNVVVGTNQPTPPMGEPYPITIQDKPGVDLMAVLVESIKRMPPCQTVDRPDMFTHWDGYFIGPNLHRGHNFASLRNGWYYFPSSGQCRLEYFTNSNLSSIPQHKSIYILGSSKEHDIFLSLVDMILHNADKRDIHHSVIGKCWGWAKVMKNNMQVTYQDWRSNYFSHMDADRPTTVLCHNEKMVQEDGHTYTENGRKVWDELFNDRWPDVILMSTGNDTGFLHGYDLHYFVKTLPPTWSGTLFLTDGAFSAADAGRGSEAEHEDYRMKIRDLVFCLNDARVRWIDGKGVSKDDRLYGAKGTNHVSGSLHFHIGCDVPYQDDSGQVRIMKVCSNITETIGQFLLGHALGPKDVFLRNSQSPNLRGVGPTQQMYCHACPGSLLPFHITPYPNMQCAKLPLHQLMSSEITKVPSNFPDKCIEEVVPFRDIDYVGNRV